MRRLTLDASYDPDADASYLKLNDGKAWEGEEVAPGVIVHFDREGEAVAIEFLSASKVLDAVRRASEDGTEAA